MPFNYQIFDNPSEHAIENNVEILKVEKWGESVKEYCVVHYGDDYEKFIMKVTRVNGKREGEALILDGDTLYMKLKYVNDALNGVMEIYSGKGVLVVRGPLLNGKESGLFEEYVNSFVVWRGYYKDGERYSVVRRSEEKRGYYEEWDVKSDELLSVAEYDKELVNKNGHCMEYEDGEMKRECWYENGVRKEVISNSMEDGMGEDDNEERRKRRRIDAEPEKLCLDGISSEFNKDSLVLYDIELECNYGVWKTNEKCYMIKQSLYENQVVEGDWTNCCMRVYDDDELKEEVMKEDCVGNRWGGGVRNGKPFGYGVMYDEEGRKEYEGFMMDGIRVCYGKEFYDDTEKVKYEGCYYEGKRFGKGVLYDRNGGIEYDGLWKEDKQYSSTSALRLTKKSGTGKSLAKLVKGMGELYSTSMQLGSEEWLTKYMEYQHHKKNTAISNHAQSLSIPSGVLYCVESFILSQWPQSLKKIVIRDHCFGRLHFFVLDGLSELQSLVVEEKSCMDESDYYDDDYYEDRNTVGICRIVNCPKLKSISIGKESFRYYQCLELKNFASLKTMIISQSCFERTQVFSLIGLGKWLN